MSNKIKIARSVSRANLPSVLEYGELAYVKNAKLIVGNGDSDFVVNDFNNLINVPESANAVTSVNGHTGTVSLTKSDLSLANVENTAISTWGGSSNVVTVGTITTGIWNAGVIPVAYGGTGLHYPGGDNQILGVNGDATALEYKTITEGTGITVSNVLDAITISVTADTYLPLVGGEIDGDLTVTGSIRASGNDVVDFIDAPRLKAVEYGRVYVRAPDDYRVIVATEYNQAGIIGIASDTFGMSVGHSSTVMQVPIAIGGFVLAYVDKLYAPGTPLTCDVDGVLTKMNATEKKAYPERIVATFDRPEKAETWNKVQVNGRHWVKVV